MAKDSARIEALGAVDELNSCIGLLRATPALPPKPVACLLRIQHDLFDLGGELAIPGHAAVTDAQVDQLEVLVNRDFNAQLPPLKEFILPGGSEAAARCHVARTLARRAERRCWTLARGEGVEQLVALIYLNRLSDLLFVLARVLARHEHGQEVLWDRSRCRLTRRSAPQRLVHALLESQQRLDRRPVVERQVLHQQDATDALVGVDPELACCRCPPTTGCPANACPSPPGEPVTWKPRPKVSRPAPSGNTALSAGAAGLLQAHAHAADVVAAHAARALPAARAGVRQACGPGSGTAR